MYVEPLYRSRHRDWVTCWNAQTSIPSRIKRLFSSSKRPGLFLGPHNHLFNWQLTRRSRMNGGIPFLPPCMTWTRRTLFFVKFSIGISYFNNGYRVFPWGKVRPGRDAEPSPPSSAEVKNRVELYLYSP
jgi:hypothetical protein